MEQAQFSMALSERVVQYATKAKPGKILFHFKTEVTAHCSKKNNRPIFRAGKGGRAFLGKSSKLTTAENTLVHAMRAEGNKLRISKPIECDLWALCLFGFKNYHLRKKAIRNKRLNDLSNLLELPMDCLQTAGIILDDNQICSFDLSRRVPSECNSIEIFLIEYDSAI